MGPKSHDWCPYEKGTYRDTQGRRPREDGGKQSLESCYDKARNECQEPPKAGRGKEEFSLRDLGGSIALKTP